MSGSQRKSWAEDGESPGGVLLEISIVRTGGFAGLRKAWRVTLTERAEVRAWRPLIEACPWDDEAGDEPVPDRFVYRMSAAEHEATVPESRLHGPWRELFDRVRAAQRDGS